MKKLQIQWTEIARNDLEHIAEYIQSDNPYAAIHIITKIFAAVENLSLHPKIGRPGRRNHTRELMIMHSPYIVVYQLVMDAIYILRVLHGARQWPSK